jgi:hypothetical protein
MKNLITLPIKAAIAFLLFTANANAQQSSVTATQDINLNKNNTRPEVTRWLTGQSRVPFVTANRNTYQEQTILRQEQVSPVIRIYPTVIYANTVNIIASLPIERITVVSGNGTQVYTQDMAGKTESITVVLPSLGKGMYWVHFTGQGWKTTEKIIIP